MFPHLDYDVFRLLDAQNDAQDFRFYLTRVKINALWHIYTKPKPFFVVPVSKRHKRSTKKSQK